MINVPPSESPNTSNQLQHEQATEHQASNPQALPHIIPLRIGVPLIALIQVDDDVGEDAEEIEGHEPEDRVVLGARGQELLDLLPANVVDLLVPRCPLFQVLRLAFVRIGISGCAVGVEEGLGGGRVGRGHCGSLVVGIWELSRLRGASQASRALGTENGVGGVYGTRERCHGGGVLMQRAARGARW
jgi:hypothetical protein